MKKYLFSLIALLFLFTGCEKKKYPPSIEENEPLFFFKAAINGQPINILAGKDSYQIYSSFEQDSNNLYCFVSTVKQNTCALSDCANSLKLKIYDYKLVAPNASVKIDSSLRVGNYSYLNDTKQTDYVVSFIGSNNKVAKSYYWDFGDGSSSTEVQPTHVYKKEGKYTVCYQALSASGCLATACSQIHVSKNNPLSVSVTHVNTDSLRSLFSPSVTGGKLPYRYHWSFGDGTFSTQKNPTHNFRFIGSYAVQLSVIDANNDTITSVYNYHTKNDVSSCTANFKATINKIVPEAYLLSKTVIEWVDDRGVRYTSKNIAQPSSSYFTLKSVESYEINETNHRTKKLNLSFKCMVASGNSVIPIDCENANVIVAYK